jgi:DNA-binding transcriptional ArsR family regulator
MKVNSYEQAFKQRAPDDGKGNSTEMKTKKSPAKSNSSSGCAEQLKVLADSTRLAVLSALMKKPMNVTQINEIVCIEQSLLSHHLKILKTAGFVTGQRKGKSVVYEVTAAVHNEEKGKSVDLGCCQLQYETT